MDTTISFKLKLNDYRKAILLALLWFDPLRLDKLKLAIKMMIASQFEYSKLLKNAAKDLAEYKNLLDAQSGTRSAPDYSSLGAQSPRIFADNEIDTHILKEIYALEALELLNCKSFDPNVPSHQKSGQNYSSLEAALPELSLTDEGKRIAQQLAEGRQFIFRPMHPQRTTIFVACAFGSDEIDELYVKHLEPVCTKLGYSPVRVDLKEASETITNSILQGIIEAECVIADLTFARPSVYFEVGFAHGLRVPLILTCRQDHYRAAAENAKVHFDLEQYKISYWAADERGVFIWPANMEPETRLRAVLREG